MKNQIKLFCIALAGAFMLTACGVSGSVTPISFGPPQAVSMKAPARAIQNNLI